MSSRNPIALSFVAVLALSGCDRKAEASGSAPPATTSSARTATAAPPASLAGDPAAPAVSTPTSPVARIVFVGKENACECTRAAIDASWAALQEALGGASIPVEQLKLDTQSALVAPYRDLQAMMAVPGLYFLDAAGGLAGMLQGEVTADQIRAILFPGS
jgi:hypothetical protein